MSLSDDVGRLDLASIHGRLGNGFGKGAAMPRIPRDLASRMAEKRARQAMADGYIRETFVLPRQQARATARAFLDRFPKQAYMSEVERWRELPGDEIEFTMRRLRTAD